MLEDIVINHNIIFRMLFRRHSKKRLHKNELKGLLESQVHKNCIFFQKPIVCFGQLQNYIMDNSSLEITLNTMPIHGLEHPGQVISLSSSWEDLTLLSAHIISYDQGWHLFFETDLIEEIRQKATENESRQDKLLKIMETLFN